LTFVTLFAPLWHYVGLLWVSPPASPPGSDDDTDDEEDQLFNQLEADLGLKLAIHEALEADVLRILGEALSRSPTPSEISHMKVFAFEALATRTDPAESWANAYKVVAAQIYGLAKIICYGGGHAGAIVSISKHPLFGKCPWFDVVPYAIHLQVWEP
jgi:hypothetical protein